MAVPLTSLPGVELDPALSPDAGRVAFVWDGPDRSNFDIYVKQIGGDETVRVTHDPAADHRPVWSPDGTRLAFLRKRGRGADVLLVPAGGGPEQKLAELSDLARLDLEDVWSYWLDWSPDGRFLAASDRGADGQSWSVFLISVETGEKRALTVTGSSRVFDRLPALPRAAAPLRVHRLGEQPGLVPRRTPAGVRRRSRRPVPRLRHCTRGRPPPPVDIEPDLRRPSALLPRRETDLLHLHAQRGLPGLEDASRRAGGRRRGRPGHATRGHRS